MGKPSSDYVLKQAERQNVPKQSFAKPSRVKQELKHHVHVRSVGSKPEFVQFDVRQKVVTSQFAENPKVGLNENSQSEGSTKEDYQQQLVKFEKVSYVEQIEHNLLSVSQVCDKKFSFHFNDSECYILKSGFVIPEEWILMKALRRNDTYVLDMSVATTMDSVPTCLLSKASESDSILWHRKLAHIIFRKMNYLVKNDLLSGIPKMKFSMPDDCIPCKKDKQHRKSHKSEKQNSIVTPLELLHIDLFRPISIRSIGGKSYCLVVTDDFSRFSWVKFLASKAETTKTVQYLILGVGEYLSKNGSISIVLIDLSLKRRLVQNGHLIMTACSSLSILLMIYMLKKLKMLYESCHGDQDCGFIPRLAVPLSVPSSSNPDPNVASSSGTHESESEDDETIFQDSSADPLIVDDSSTSTQVQGELPTNLVSVIPVTQTVPSQAETTHVDVLPIPEVASIKEIKDHPVTNIIGNLQDGVQTRSLTENTFLYSSIRDTGVLDVCSYSCFISQIEPKNMEMALQDNNWIEAM
ncbi:hypothetical protein L1987_19082 [Smallanthus sonchifolius]|uniref:Uncharacterized protein n=1 Tax=Smallanthus sonchifolius TaxID=185202 RepID=A0ACB9J3K9_9ASTR|nr:hypothetical protein L1987_19082 [Smallanthus sonchifolius]